MDRGTMAGTLIVDIFLSVDGWAGSDKLPGHFGYFTNPPARTSRVLNAVSGRVS
jgi:hypothetical protein